MTTSVILFEDYSPERDHPNNGIINEQLSNFLGSSFTYVFNPYGTTPTSSIKQSGEEC